MLKIVVWLIKSPAFSARTEQFEYRSSSPKVSSLGKDIWIVNS
jgi:hypothetical protein